MFKNRITMRKKMVKKFKFNVWKSYSNEKEDGEQIKIECLLIL